MGILNDYMAMSYRMEIVEDKDEGGFVNFYPDLPGCINITGVYLGNVKIIVAFSEA